MKNVIKLIIVTLIMMMLAGCSGSGSSNGQNTKKKITDDLDLMSAHIKAPEEFEKVNRFCDVKVDGTLIEKDIDFYFNDDESYTVAYIPNTKMADLVDPQTLESYEENGKTVYLFNTGNNALGFIELENDLLVFYYLRNELDVEGLKNYIKEVTYTSNSSITTDNTDIDNVEYVLNDDWKMYEYTTSYTENKDGEPLEKIVGYKFGGSKEEETFRFGVYVYYNTTIEEKLADKIDSYVETKINDVTYMAYQSDPAEKIFSYYTAYGDNVYQFRNSGKGDLFVTRTDESYVAFEEFMNSVKFK